MNDSKAKAYLSVGYKVTNDLWSPDEFMEKEGECYVFENGVYISINLFWGILSPRLRDGWGLYNPHPYERGGW